MIPSMHGIQHAIMPKSPLATPIANTTPFRGSAGLGSAAPVATPSPGGAQGASVATALGQITADTLTLLGLGANTGHAGTVAKATQAYAASGQIH